MDNQNTAKTKKVAYWSDGFWTDPESASLAVQVGAFSADYKMAEFPHDLPPEQIDKEVLQLVKQAG